MFFNQFKKQEYKYSSLIIQFQLWKSCPVLTLWDITILPSLLLVSGVTPDPRVVVRIPAEAAAVRADTVVGTVDTDVTTTCEAAHGLIWATR